LRRQIARRVIRWIRLLKLFRFFKLLRTIGLSKKCSDLSCSYVDFLCHTGQWELKAGVVGDLLKVHPLSLRSLGEHFVPLVQTFKFVLFIFLIAHLAACFFYAIALSEVTDGLFNT
jgi:hypothetical protein